MELDSSMGHRHRAKSTLSFDLLPFYRLEALLLITYRLDIWETIGQMSHVRLLLSPHLCIRLLATAIELFLCNYISASLTPGGRLMSSG